MLARTWAMIARHHLGDLAASQRHADICIEMATPANQTSRLISILDPVVAALAESSRNAWMMGDSAGCLDRTRRALSLAREIKHPDSLSFALLFYGWLHGHCDDWQTCLSATTEAIALGTEHGLVQTHGVEPLRAWLGGRSPRADRRGTRGAGKPVSMPRRK